eukprot:TRINITY_DN84080_c0_g1_i1.p1 TRINITY_DN84080_c0_g1~~TRINITY_DN84080_c0_g1_i1.p1  ORF type:complete len:245 (+),score=74.94 TRINITY_DN84080_c0_g1_i1:35-769(+)
MSLGSCFASCCSPSVAMGDTTFNWPPLESNPEIFTDYMRKCGLPAAWGFGEVFGFDEELLAFIPQPVLGVVVNMERLKKAEDKERGSEGVEVDYYMKQTDVLDNACGVIACIHAIANNRGAGKIELVEGKTLSDYLQKVASMSPAERATALEGFTAFQEEHKAHAAEGQSNQAQEQSEVRHHFVAFVVNSKGQLVELDGTKKGPHVVKEECSDVLRGTIEEMKKRLAAGEISESLSMITLNKAD